MRHFIVWLNFLYLTLSPAVQLPSTAAIHAPVNGQAVQGLVEILGNTAVEGFSAYELAFMLEGDPTQTWFPIIRSTEPVEDGQLGEWRTSTLTDGSYSLRLTVEIQGQAPEIILVEGLRVRNYTAVETNTPAPTQTLAPGVLPTATATDLPPTPTALPGNPAELETRQIKNAAITGGVIAAATLLFLVVYSAVKRRG